MGIMGMPDGNTVALRRREAQDACAERARDAALGGLPRLVLDHLTDPQDLDDADFADFLAAYVLADPQACSALRRLIRACAPGVNLGHEARRESVVAAAARFSELALQQAHRIYGPALIERQVEMGRGG